MKDLESRGSFRESSETKPTIPQIAEALDELFSWKNIESQEMKNAIKETYELIDLILKKTPNTLKSSLLRGTYADSHFQTFINNLKQDYPEDRYSEIFDKYIDFFERWWEERTKQRKKITAKYNPNRVEKELN